MPHSGQEAATSADEHADVDAEELRMRQRVHARLFGSTAVETTRIGRFVVIDKLGAGGLGIVYAAHDPRLDRRVALKVVRSGLEADRSAALLREAQAMARLTHPNVAVVYEAGRAGDELFIAMELVDGVTLRRWAAQRERSWTEIRDVVVDAGRGIAAAHRSGLCHRDFKPGNVLVQPDGRAKVVDFGLAHGLDDRAIEGFAGTPPYMAPELWDGTGGDARADQWAFCVTLWELLHGARPFVADDLASLRAAVLAAALPARPAGTKVPRWLHEALVRGLQRDPDARHPSMDTLLDALCRDRRSRRRRWIAAAILVLAIGGTAWTATAIERARLEEELVGRIDALADEARAAAADRHWIYPAQDGDGTTAYGRVVALEELAGGRSQAARARANVLREEFTGELVALGDALWDDPNGRGFARDFYAAARLFDPTHARAIERSSLTPGQLAELQAKAADGSFRPDEVAAAQLLEAVATPDPAVRRDRVATLLRTSPPVAASTRRQLEALAPADAPVEPPSPTVAPPPPVAPTPSDRAGPSPTPTRDRAAAEPLTKQGHAALERDQLDEAAQLFHRALAEHPGHAGALAGLSEVHFERGSYHRALEYATKAVDAAPKNGRYRKLLADVYVRVLRYPEAERAYESALERGYEPARAALARLRARVGKTE